MLSQIERGKEREGEGEREGERGKEREREGETERERAFDLMERAEDVLGEIMHVQICANKRWNWMWDLGEEEEEEEEKRDRKKSHQMHMWHYPHTLEISRATFFRQCLQYGKWRAWNKIFSLLSMCSHVEGDDDARKINNAINA